MDGKRVTVRLYPDVPHEAEILERLEGLPRTRGAAWLRDLLVAGFQQLEREGQGSIDSGAVTGLAANQSFAQAPLTSAPGVVQPIAALTRKAPVAIQSPSPVAGESADHGSAAQLKGFF